MNPRCEAIPPCSSLGSHVLRSNQNIYTWFCDKHFKVYKELRRFWTYNSEEDKLHRQVAYPYIPVGAQVRMARGVGELKAGDIVTVKETNEMNDVWLIKQVNPRELPVAAGGCGMAGAQYLTFDYGWTRRENVEPLWKEAAPEQEMTKDPYK